VGIGHDVGGVEEMVVRQVADRAAVIVGGEDQVAEGGLMQPLLDQAEGVPALDRVGRGRPSCGPRELAERNPGGQSPGSQSTMKVGMMTW
jgi:hypothetical protein